MKRWFWLLSMLTIALGVVTTRAQVPGGKGPADVGPGDGGATLKLPGLEPTAPGNAGGAKPVVIPDYLKGKVSAFPTPAKGSTPIALPASNNTDINKDIEITPQAGQWMIFVMAYGGDNAPQMARKFALALRETYKLNAYVFNYGAKEKQAEYERVQKIRQEQIDEMRKAGIRGEIPFRVATMKIEEQTGVLIGGYRTFDEASNDLKNRIKKLNPEPLKGKVDLDMWFISNVKVDRNTKKVDKVDLEDLPGLGYVNPFRRAFPARNPSLPKENSGPSAEEDYKFLQLLNREEPYTLLQCKKPLTLAVVQFNMQTKAVANAKEASGFLDRFQRGLVRFGQEWQDVAAQNAHALAKELRKAGLEEAYVLHCQNCSFVTIGAFDRIDDPRLVAMQNWLETYFKHPAFAQNRVPLFPRAIPMPVPTIQGIKMPS
ncbi:MAG: hypothetical protein HY289_05525 [Planctomycetes bacterium]|nr:hypothetical protein [Planctomycetota bacterium]